MIKNQVEYDPPCGRNGTTPREAPGCQTQTAGSITRLQTGTYRKKDYKHLILRMERRKFLKSDVCGKSPPVQLGFGKVLKRLKVNQAC